MLASFLSRWEGKLFILILLGFVATDFIITITLSAADATAHVVENPVLHRHLETFPTIIVNVVITLVLITFLCGIFLKGFKEAIGIAVVLVVGYLVLNVIVVGLGIYHVAINPSVISNWREALFEHPRVNGSWVMLILIGLLIFPKLALGLSGFETGVAVMPLVAGSQTDKDKHPHGRIRNTKTFW
jgi:hypothetical protein